MKILRNHYLHILTTTKFRNLRQEITFHEFFCLTYILVFYVKSSPFQQWVKEDGQIEPHHNMVFNRTNVHTIMDIGVVGTTSGNISLQICISVSYLTVRLNLLHAPCDNTKSIKTGSYFGFAKLFSSVCDQGFISFLLQQFLFLFHDFTSVHQILLPDNKGHMRQTNNRNDME